MRIRCTGKISEVSVLSRLFADREIEYWPQSDVPVVDRVGSEVRPDFSDCG